jgi:hypothetical protein
LNFILETTQFRFLYKIKRAKLDMQELVRFYAYYRIKLTCFTPFAPRPTNFFGFSFATVLSRRNGYRVNIVSIKNNIVTTIHRWRWEVTGYLILFPVLTFVPQRRSLLDKKFSPLVFYLVFLDIALTHKYYLVYLTQDPSSKLLYF